MIIKTIAHFAVLCTRYIGVVATDLPVSSANVVTSCSG